VRGLAAISACRRTAGVTASAGNHGLASRGLRRASAPSDSRRAENSSPPRSRRSGPIDRADRVRKRLRSRGKRGALRSGRPRALFISPYNDPNVNRGQATSGRELDSQLPGESPSSPRSERRPALGLCLWARSRSRVQSSASSQTSRVECPPQSPPGGSSACPWADHRRRACSKISSRLHHAWSRAAAQLVPLTTTSFARDALALRRHASSQKARGGCGRGRAQPQVEIPAGSCRP